ncbi:MAG: XdhC family protein [Deltaproteobacteria bacterium]|nr:XdhC family protein [Deltaproteobacteria bacterium]
MDPVYTKIVELFEQNRFSVLATIIRQTGSAPRGVGTKFIVMEDGSSFGTIGGGLLEAKAVESAKEVFESGFPVRLKMLFTGKDVAETDMICGGEAEVFLEPLFLQNPTQYQIVKKAMEVLQKGGKGVLATVVAKERWTMKEAQKIFLGADGEKIGNFKDAPEAEDRIAKGMAEILQENRTDVILLQDSEGKDIEIFVEPVSSDPAIYIFGGGHVSGEIIPLARRVGFKVVVVDDRAEFADPKRFPDATDVFEYPFEGVMEKFLINQSAYLVVVTRGHIHDKTVLTQALGTPARYIGMIGSRRKRDMIYSALLQEGFSQADIDRVHSPIGLAIGAETPEEIAVSIVAELIMVRAGVEEV